MSDESENSGFIKKLLTAGLGTFFLTEEALRTLLAEAKLPKELLSKILEGASNTRKEFTASLTREIVDRAMEKVDARALLQELVRENEFEVELKIRVKPKA
jgi:hypothetical protein